MPEFFRNSLSTPPLDLLDLTLRLLVALAFGLVVARIYRASRKATDVIASFPTTLVLLSILIAMVTQVIGDNVARAFSLVGALSIVRFRTVVRDTQDTAYVIFAVAVGMAVGARHVWVAFVGAAVIALAALLVTRRSPRTLSLEPAYTLNLRLALGHDGDAIISRISETHLQDAGLVSIATAKQGTALDLSYETRLRPGISPNALVKALNTTEGVQSVELSRRDLDAD